MAVVPEDTRYVPLTQQPYCCVPTCLQIVAVKNHLPLLSQEFIGAQLGLVVSPEEADKFYNVAVSEKPVVSSGFGTRIQVPEYSLDNFIEQQNWPFILQMQLASRISNESALLDALKDIESDNTDAMICYQNDRGSGHVVVFDRIVGDQIRVIDPSPLSAKWRLQTVADVLSRIKRHGDDNSGGIWKLVRE